MKINTLKSVLAMVAAFVGINAFADAQSDIENKIRNEVAGHYRAITAKANAQDDVWMSRHAEKAAAAANGSIVKDVVFLGDDAMAGWER